MGVTLENPRGEEGAGWAARGRARAARDALGELDASARGRQPPWLGSSGTGTCRDRRRLAARGRRSGARARRAARAFRIRESEGARGGRLPLARARGFSGGAPRARGAACGLVPHDGRRDVVRVDDDLARLVHGALVARGARQFAARPPAPASRAAAPSAGPWYSNVTSSGASRPRARPRSPCSRWTCAPPCSARGSPGPRTRSRTPCRPRCRSARTRAARCPST